MTELRLLDFAKGAFFEANRGKNHTLYLYLPKLLICVKGITEVVFDFVFSFTVKEGSKKERRPIANRQILYQLSLLPHFLPHGATVTLQCSEIPGGLCHSLSVDLSNTALAQRGLINELPGNAFGNVTRIRQVIIIITFDPTNVVLHNGITFGTGIDVDSRDRNIVTVVPYQDIIIFGTLPKRYHYKW